MHINIWGLSQVSSLGGSYYYVNFIDDAPKKNWIYCNRNEFSFFDTFKKLRALVENETGNKLKLNSLR